MKFYISLVFVLAGLFSFAQEENCELLDNDARQRVETHLQFLSSDELAGRAPGTEGIEQAADYISAQFKAYGLESISEEGFEQPFDIAEKATIGTNNSFEYKGKQLVLLDDFYPTRYSSSANVTARTVFVKYGITAKELDYNDYKKLSEKKLKGKIFVMDIGSPDGIHPHSEYLKYHDLEGRVDLAISKGAVGVVFVNINSETNDLSPVFSEMKGRKIPVMFLKNKAIAKKIKKNKEISISTDIKENFINTSNIVGFMDNQRAYTIVVGAHYDHLGMGGESSLYASKEPAIHNGADDNASGVSGMLELARYITANRTLYKDYNFLFLAFSGEEKGLLGSNFFVKSDFFKEIECNYMINLDMIGRMEDNLIAVSGVGTSEFFKEFFSSKYCTKINAKTSESGVGPSDHTSFYYKNVPVLHFFTGTHVDYHKPSDDFEKINVKGEMMVLNMILELIDASFMKGEHLQFQKTAVSKSVTPNFSVTLGVMPDYLYSGNGMKIDGVSEGKPAANAEMLAGDIVVQLGDYVVSDMNTYMIALSKFKKGDKTQVSFMRGSKKMVAEIQF